MNQNLTHTNPGIVLRSLRPAFLWLFLFAFQFFASGVFAQVTVGTLSVPERAAVLQVKTQDAASPSSVTDDNNVTSVSGGLGLPRVWLVNNKTLEPFISTTDEEWDETTGTSPQTNRDVTKRKHAGLMVYNINNNYRDTSLGSEEKFRQGIYVWDGAQWQLQGNTSAQRFFYMPAFNLPLDEITGNGDPDVTINLYDVYAWQFTNGATTTGRTGDHPGMDGLAPVYVNNTNNSTAIKTIPSPLDGLLYRSDDLDYAVVYYDAGIIGITKIDDDGTMYYRVLDNDPGPESFMTVVFVVKD